MPQKTRSHNKTTAVRRGKHRRPKTATHPNVHLLRELSLEVKVHHLRRAVHLRGGLLHHFLLVAALLGCLQGHSTLKRACNTTNTSGALVGFSSVALGTPISCLYLATRRQRMCAEESLLVAASAAPFSRAPQRTFTILVVQRKLRPHLHARAEVAELVGARGRPENVL